MKSLITGIAGFAGSHLAEHLLQRGDELLGLIRAPASAAKLPASLSGVPLAAWDLASAEPSPERAAQSIRDFAPQCIYHLAALSLPSQCGERQPTAACLATNVEGTRRIVDLACALPAPPRLVFVSSSRVYAPVVPECARVDEEYPLDPDRGYGQSKRLAEQIVLDAVRTRGLDAVIVRAFQHTGPRQDGRLMLPEWSKQLADDRCTQVRVRRLDAYIDCCDVRDVVRAYRLLASAAAAGQVYNVGSGVVRRSGDVLEQLCRAAGRRPQIIELQPGRTQDPIANVDRLVAATGWRSEIPWEQTLRDTLDDWRQRLSPAAGPKSSLESTV